MGVFCVYKPSFLMPEHYNRACVQNIRVLGIFMQEQQQQKLDYNHRMKLPIIGRTHF